jgi:formate/nitrite transporter FocA (FNT family)
VIEILAAAAGALISAAAVVSMTAGNRNEEARIAITKLTSSVEHIAATLEVIHVDMRETNRELFGRLSQVENRVTKLEVQ